MSVRLRLNAREQQAVSLCVLHEHSRRDASDIMGIDIKRLDKIMVAANKKLGGLLEAISRGEWCEDQRSLIKAYAFGLHEEGGERHALAVAHVMECQACAAYVRSLARPVRASCRRRRCWRARWGPGEASSAR